MDIIVEATHIEIVAARIKVRHLRLFAFEYLLLDHNTVNTIITKPGVELYDRVLHRLLQWYGSKLEVKIREACELVNSAVAVGVNVNSEVLQVVQGLRNNNQEDGRYYDAVN